MAGVKTVKFMPLLATPPAAVTTTFPVVAPAGTTAVMLVLLHGPTVVAAVPLNFTVPLPWLAPKLVPVMLIDVPTGPDVTDRLVMLGAGTTVKAEPLLATPLTVTTTLPVVVPAGATAVILVLLQGPTVVAVVPLNFTVLVPCVAPKVEPAITMEEPMAPLFGVRLVMAGETVKLTPLLVTPLTVTTRLPLVAPAGTTAVILPTAQLEVTAATPLKVTLPGVAPKPLPAITIAAPTGPEFGVKLLLQGVTVNGTPMLGLPPTVTTTLPVMAPLATGT
jgi:hypothetical protein